MYDIIGDIHGHATALTQLLQQMGYRLQNGAYSHPTRKVIFVGDYIDRGPQIRETLAIVKSMTDSDNAIALMGNHEYNALCYYHHHPQGGHLRKHSIKNTIQHFETLRQFQNRQSEYEAYIEWMMTLPLYYENEHFRVVHACWDAQEIAFMRSKLDNDRLNQGLLVASADPSSRLYQSIETTLKGKEIRLPEGIHFKDKDGTVRRDIRIKWWENSRHNNYRQMSVIALDNIPEQPIPTTILAPDRQYSEDDKPIFFGHYWLKGKPVLQKTNVCCTDYSVAKGGLLVAYRWSGTPVLNEDNLVWVRSV